MGKRTVENQEDTLAFGLANGWSLRRSSKEAGLPQTTARRWASDPAFKRRVAVMRQEVVGAAVGRLAVVASAAVDTLEELLAAGVDPETRLRAAKAVLSELVALGEFADLSARVEALEAETSEKSHATF